jgi:hypothetical protein
MDPGCLEGEAFGATRIGGEQIAQWEVAGGAVVPFQGQPRGASCERFRHLLPGRAAAREP